MPLLRLVNHPKDNKYHVDKMIRIEGLPDKYFYFQRNGKNYIKEPWFIDVTENIPEYVRAVHQPIPFKVNKYIPAPEKGIPPIDDEIEAYGLGLDYQLGNGEEMWLQIERIIDQNTPRGERVPEPVKIADIDDAHRNRPFSISAESIPVVYIKGMNIKPMEEPPKLVTPVAPLSEAFPCQECNKTFSKKKGLLMHKMKAHSNKTQNVEVGV